MTRRAVFSFVLLATLITLLMSWLIPMGVLPIQQIISHNAAGRSFIQVWFKLAITVGLILPSIAWLLWFRNPQPRRILDFYLSVLIIQILTERVFISLLFPSLAVIIGTLYTAFRIWQLRHGQQLIRQNSWDFSNRKQLNVLLSILLVFWCSNLVMLLTLGWSGILSK